VIPIASFETDVPFATAPAAPVEKTEGAGADDIITVIRSQMGAATLFHTDDETAYASFDRSGRQITVPIASATFKLFVRGAAYKACGAPLSTRQLDDIVAQFETEALFDWPLLKVYHRVASADGAIHLDLADAVGNVVRITEAGWDVGTFQDVRFVTNARTRPLPVPQRGGTLGLLRPFVNVATDEGFTLLLGFLLDVLKPHGPYCVLAIDGPQGSAKSTLTKIIKRTVDPTKPDIRSLTGKPEDLLIAAMHSRVVAADNVSGLSAQLSDVICGITTGTGYATRRYYTNLDEVYTEVCGPVILNGIDGIAERGDLADRSIHIELTSIAEEDRRDEKEFWGAYDNVLPLVLGALCDAASTALRRAPTVKLKAKPRMADTAIWVTAAEPALGLPEGTFVEAFKRNRAESLSSTAHGDMVALEILEFAQKHATKTIALTATQLLSRLGLQNPTRTQDRYFPKTPALLSGRIKRAKDALRALGVEIDFIRAGHSGDRKIEISWVPPAAATRVTSLGSVTVGAVSNVVPLRPPANRADDDADDDADDEELPAAPPLLQQATGITRRMVPARELDDGDDQDVAAGAT
jgi:hypothetical protein